MRNLAHGSTCTARSRIDRQSLNGTIRCRICGCSEMAPAVQAYMEDYIPKYVPTHRPVYTYFDVYDLEEKRV